MISEQITNPKIIIVITRQLNELQKKCPDGVKVHINDTDVLDIQADVMGPVDTPYHGGVFKCKLVLPTDFPKTAPKG